ncbi:hypothetical protein J6590_080095 [Homalodisca vitripennis]|nr:hypothetical protein J6590_080095 [Homalodisca vitripennis]
MSPDFFAVFSPDTTSNSTGKARPEPVTLPFDTYLDAMKSDNLRLTLTSERHQPEPSPPAAARDVGSGDPDSVMGDRRMSTESVSEFPTDDRHLLATLDFGAPCQNNATKCNKFKIVHQNSQAATNRIDCLNLLADEVMPKVMKNRSFIIIEDFNVDVLNVTDMKTRELGDLLKTFDLHWSVNSPIRVTATTATAINNVIINMPSVALCLIVTALSDHDAQLVTLTDFAHATLPPQTVVSRATRPENIAAFCKLLEKET